MAVQTTLTHIYKTRVVHTTIADGIATCDVTDTHKIVATVTGADTLTRRYSSAKPWRPHCISASYRRENGGPWYADAPHLTGFYVKKDGSPGQQPTDTNIWPDDPGAPAWVAEFVTVNTPKDDPSTVV